MPVSIRDVAHHAGVSPATVSRVLRNDPTMRISAATQERVRLAVQALQYQPSPSPSKRKVRRLRSVGLLFPPGDSHIIRHPFFSAQLDGVVVAAAQRQMNVTMLTGHPRGDFGRLLEAFHYSGCEGLLAFWQPLSEDSLSLLLDADVPLVLMNDTRPDMRLSCVEVESQDSSRRLIHYLFGLGHTRIALFAAGPGDHQYVLPRIAGYREAHAERGIEVDEKLIMFNQNSWEPHTIRRGVDSLLLRPASQRPTALFCTDDDSAAVAIAALSSQGVEVPDDFSVAGFNDDGSADRLNPTLTTLRQPYDRLAAEAIDMLLEQVTDLSKRGRRVVLPAELVVRGSTAPPPVSHYAHLII